MLRTFAVLGFGVALIIWGTQYMAGQHATTRGSMLGDLASGLMGAIDDVTSDDEAAMPTIESDELAIAGTAGAGVGLRDDCLDDARVEGALPEGASVTRLSLGEGRCAGWSLVHYLTDEADVQTWVRDEYLAVPASE